MSLNQLSEPIPIVALVYDKLCTFEFGIVAEIFGLPRPELSHELYRFSSVSLEDKTLSAAGGLVFHTKGTLSALNNAHTIVIPGWRGKDAPVPKKIIECLRDAHARGVRLLSICSGAYVLAAAGILDKRRVTTHWRYADDLQLKFPNINVQVNVLYVEQDNIVTSAGSSAGIDACLHIIRTDYGAKTANVVARRLVMHSHRQGGQAQFIEQPVPQSGEDLHIAQLIENIRSDLSAEYQISSMAKFVGMPLRTFQRRFQTLTGISDIEWLTRERVLLSCQLLETTDISIDRISQLVGFGTAETLRYHFRQALDLSPSEYRKRFTVLG